MQNCFLSRSKDDVTLGKASEQAHEVDLAHKSLEMQQNKWPDGDPGLRERFQDFDKLLNDVDCPGPGSSFRR